MKLAKIFILAIMALPCIAQAQTEESIPAAQCGKTYCIGSLFNGATLVGTVAYYAGTSSLGQFDQNGQNGMYVTVAADGTFPAIGPYPAGKLTESYYTVKRSAGRYGYTLVTYMTGTITVQ